MNRVVLALVIAALVVMAGAVASSAQASGFPDYRQAAGEQYGGEPPVVVPAADQEAAGDELDELEEGSGTRGDGDAGKTDKRGDSTGQGAGGDPLLTLNLVFLSPVDPVIVDGTNAVLAQLDGTKARVLSLIEPLKLAEIATASAGRRYADISERRLSLIRRLGRETARELVRPSPFWDRLGPVLFTMDLPLRASRYIVFARSGEKLATRAATRVRNAFEIGLVEGARRLRVEGNRRKRLPIAGVETTATDPSQIRWYKRRHLPSVDNLDTVNGQRALLAILRDGAKGHYGVKDTADRLLPPGIDADPAASVDAKSDAGLGTNMTIGLLLLMGAFTTITALRRMRGPSRRSAR